MRSRLGLLLPPALAALISLCTYCGTASAQEFVPGLYMPTASQIADTRNRILRVTPPPHVHHYDQEKDELVHLTSVLTPPHAEPLGGEVGYYGNRLRRYTYLGRPGTGGYYEDLVRYQDSMNLDWRKYRYRD